MKKKAKKTRTMQTLAALIAVAIFLLPVAHANPLFSKEEGLSQSSLKEEGLSERDDLKEESQGNEFSLGNKLQSTDCSETVSFSSRLKSISLKEESQSSLKGESLSERDYLKEESQRNEFSLTAPRSQVYCCVAYLPQAIVGAIMSCCGVLGMCVSGILLLVAAVVGIIDWLVTLIASVLVGVGDLPWAWENLLVAAAGSLLV
jgi:hypothetical protein